ncbi:hypothetical protein PT974_06535 [Cladobotryum mycophilum]|uniref:DUF7371 domain-containing protein n=1 Tax=Cladobotryum mycophilum TaxID=491253 RepID=A0ABR0SMI4_9HYPO
MRAPTSLAVLMASTLAHHSNAQAAGYGTPDANNGGSPGGTTAGSSGGTPNGIPDGNAYGNTGGIPNGIPNGNPGGIPGASPDASTCAAQAAVNTVFVTVYPTGPLNPSGLPQPGGSDPDQTVYQTLHPTTTVLVSPVQSPQATQSAVQPFTTLTIDIWGDDPGSGANTGPVIADPSSAPVYTNAVPTPAGSSVIDPNGSAASTQGPWSNPLPAVDSGVPSGLAPGSASTAAPANVPYGDASGLSGTSGFPIPGSATVSSPYVVVTDTDVHWVPGPQGPTQITILSPHTITFGPNTLPSPGPAGSVPRLTFTGLDGKPTVVEYPGGLPTNGDGSAQTVSTGVSGPAILSDAGVATCTSYTILGPNGLPTVVHSTWTVNAVTAAPLVSLQVFHHSLALVKACQMDLESRPAQATPFLDLMSALAASSGIPDPSLSGIPGQITPGPIPPSQSGPFAPGGAVITTCATYTVLGPDGRPTVIDSTWVIPAPSATNAATVNAITGDPNQISGFPGYPSLPSGINTGVNGLTTCTSYTILGPNGLPTVVESTWVIPVATATNAATANVITGIPNQVTGFPGYHSQVAGTVAGVDGVTTCTSYTVLGPDGLPTVVESTFIVPASNALPTATNLGYPSAIPQGVTDLPPGLPPFTPGSGAITTCITAGVVGPDGRATPVVQTVVITPGGSGNALPVQTTIGFPSLVPQQDQTALPQGVPPAITANQPITTSITVNVLGPNGVVTPIVQTIILTPTGPGIGLPTAPVLTGVPPLPSSGLPGLNGYGTPPNGLQTILPPSAAVSGVIADSETTVTGTYTSIFTVITGPGGPSVLPPPSYNDPLGNGSPLPASAQLPQNTYSPIPTEAVGLPNSPQYGPLPPAANSPHLALTLQTSTWTNIIPEQTTTYTLNFPLTTMATVTIPSPFSPNKRAIRRQQSSLTTESAWGNSSSTASNTLSQNTSLGASLSSALGSQSVISPPTVAPVPTTVPSQVSPTVVSPVAPTMCANGGKIGNSTLDFDEVKPGPLFNPTGDIWFSEGFVIVPPSSQAAQAYIPSSGGQLIEFVPLSLSSTSSTSGTRDTAEIGVGPNAASSCFRFDLHGASLGCAAQGNEQWCEFEISAYAYNQGSTKEQSVAWSETKRVPACPSFPSGSCQLTPVQFDGYTNLTSVLIKLHVGLDLRVWWGDDLRIGWTDNSCTAATCRASAIPHRVKRKTIESVAQRGVWHWTPSGLERLDDEYIWESLH